MFCICTELTLETPWLKFKIKLYMRYSFSLIKSKLFMDKNNAFLVVFYILYILCAWGGGLNFIIMTITSLVLVCILFGFEFNDIEQNYFAFLDSYPTALPSFPAFHFYLV